VEFVACDLADLDAVRAFCAAWTRPLSALVLNAGVMMAKPSKTGEFETTFAINHVGNATFFFGIKAHLTPDARVIVVSSELHSTEARSGRPHWTTAADVAVAKDPEMKGSMVTYANSKLANMLFSHALSRRAPEGWAVIAWTPGFVPAGGSKLSRDRGMLAAVAMPVVAALLGLAGALGYPMASLSTVPRSGKALAELVTGPQHAREKGVYYQIESLGESSAQSRDTALQDDLWDWTVRQLGVDGKI
jgi:NAD(P)-dependent dehydrogenase (short-subunit alcohol dehydrogenase family)